MLERSPVVLENRGATARRLPGTGLGLAIVRQVAEGRGGLELPARAVEPRLR